MGKINWKMTYRKNFLTLQQKVQLWWDKLHKPSWGCVPTPVIGFHMKFKQIWTQNSWIIFGSNGSATDQAKFATTMLWCMLIKMGTVCTRDLGLCHICIIPEMGPPHAAGAVWGGPQNAGLGPNPNPRSKYFPKMEHLF